MALFLACASRQYARITAPTATSTESMSAFSMVVMRRACGEEAASADRRSVPRITELETCALLSRVVASAERLRLPATR